MSIVSKYYFSSLFIILWWMSPLEVIAQTNIERIKFELIQSLRIPDHIVTIEMTKRGDTASIHVISKPMENSKEWNHTAMDTSYSMDISRFSQIANLIQKISQNDIEKSKVDGFDGYTCTIGFGIAENLLYYSVWSPDYATKKRKLTEFMRVCTLIIKTADLNKRKLM